MTVWPPGLPMIQWGLPFFAIIVGVMLDRGLFPGAGRLAQPPFFANYFLFLTTIGSREYHSFVKGSIDSDLKVKGRRAA
jgi:hypothetical protein